MPPKPNPKGPKPKGKTKEKLCDGTGKQCTKTSDCQLRNCVTTTKTCERPKFKPACYSDADCNQAPKCIVKPGGKKVKGKPAPKHCKGNDVIECTNDVHCRVDGCSGKKCSSAIGKYFNPIYSEAILLKKVIKYNIEIMYHTIFRRLHL